MRIYLYLTHTLREIARPIWGHDFILEPQPRPNQCASPILSHWFYDTIHFLPWYDWLSDVPSGRAVDTFI